jgi:uncharacterized protein
LFDLFRTRNYLVSNRPQAEEILENARIMVAFIDEKQRLRKAEEGTVDYFRRCAIQVGVQPENIRGPIELTAQFRAAGNSDFVKVLDKALYEEIPTGFSHRNFALQVHEAVEDLEAYLQDKIDSGYSARLLAGFCWEWSDPNYDGTLVHDVQVGHWSRPWNRKAGNIRGARIRVRLYRRRLRPRLGMARRQVGSTTRKELRSRGEAREKADLGADSPAAT